MSTTTPKHKQLQVQVINLLLHAAPIASCASSRLNPSGAKLYGSMRVSMVTFGTTKSIISKALKAE
jgi:hypothetical protein